MRLVLRAENRTTGAVLNCKSGTQVRFVMIAALRRNGLDDMARKIEKNMDEVQDTEEQEDVTMQEDEDDMQPIPDAPPATKDDITDLMKSYHMVQEQVHCSTQATLQLTTTCQPPVPHRHCTGQQEHQHSGESRHLTTSPSNTTRPTEQHGRAHRARIRTAPRSCTPSAYWSSACILSGINSESQRC